ncbi:baseplate J/gp47 family protein [Cellvibrio sp. QJXJ]|uniref:baseplate J/gp47 family protein n=1 Tax=Cellvibrio sp. QJXJ TaxID=2964606 RepID=UPI0021C2651A|nr:baseplate J/gp47 family protein [Cellvibrio sp. QJXJ]UUA73104.1 baseplate J/gp47 family protein [Cellvibrio sp. QJXJ]
MTTEFDKAFEKMVVDAGLPTTDAQAKQKWNSVAQEVNSPFNNNSDYSPFWRTISALVTAPLMWIVKDLLLTQLLPNMFLRTAKGVFLELFGWAVDLPLKQAAKAKGAVVFARLLAAGEVIIPAGTVVQSPVINGKTYHLITLASATMLDGVASVSVNCEAVEAGAGYNLPAGYYAILPVAVPGVDSVTNTANWLQSAGADKESDDDYRLRIRNQFTAVNQYHTDSVYTKIITSFANINTRNVFFQHDAPRGPGTANAFILMDVGQPSGQLLADIETHVMDDGNHGHGDDLRVFAMPETFHNLVATIQAVPNTTPEEKTQLQASVYDAIAAAFRQNNQYAMTLTQPWSEFSFSRLAAELHALFPDLYAVSFSLPSITSTLNVPRLSSLQVVYP